MGIFDFVKEAGEKLFGADEAAKTAPDVTAKPAPVAASAATLHMHLKKLGLAPDDLSVSFNNGVATVKGTIDDAADRERIVVALGNVAGVAQVDDQLEMEGEAPEPQLYTVQPGDTLGKIAKQYYGDAMKYPVIFEANQPMLKNPDLIYPGQVLRIPPQDA